MNLLQYRNFYLVGIKGVAMTSLAQMLIDAGGQVRGSDVAMEFVTQYHLDRLNITIDHSFTTKLPPTTDCVIYTAAHRGQQNPQVQQAIANDIPVFSQAEAVAFICNQQRELAICGVGGKSTTSAMIVWILEQQQYQPTYSVGVGNIPRLNRTGRWNSSAEWSVVEGDEYASNPEEVSQGKPVKPRFSFLKPEVIVCTNIKHDHPDVYPTFNDTLTAFDQFFANLPATGLLIINQQDADIITNLTTVKQAPYSIVTFGEQPNADFKLQQYKVVPGKTISQFQYQGSEYQLELSVPGKYNVLNALAAIAACQYAGVSPELGAAALSSFPSTQRRFEFRGTKDGVRYYDDYAHHPLEIKAVIAALQEWFPQQRTVVAFQPHTFSRTKELFDQFVTAFADVENLILLDIFASAREELDASISSNILGSAIEEKYHHQVRNLHTIDQLAAYCQTELEAGDVLLTIGAGDIYKVHQMV